jgi:hypothetical protein
MPRELLQHASTWLLFARPLQVLEDFYNSRFYSFLSDRRIKEGKKVKPVLFKETSGISCAFPLITHGPKFRHLVMSRCKRHWKVWCFMSVSIF